VSILATLEQASRAEIAARRRLQLTEREADRVHRAEGSLPWYVVRALRQSAAEHSKAARAVKAARLALMKRARELEENKV